MIAIIDYGAGNLRSIGRALEAAGEATIITADPDRSAPPMGSCFPASARPARHATARTKPA